MKKNRKGETLTAKIGRNLALSLVIFAAVRANAGPANGLSHELMYATEFSTDNILSFYSDAPSIILSSHAITGLQSSEDIRGIDEFNGVLYGLGSSSRLYMINPNTGAATALGGQFSAILNGSVFGVDNGPSGFRVVSNLGQSLLVDRSTGIATLQTSPAYAAADPHFGATPEISALAFNSGSATWFAGDSFANAFSTFNPGTGALNTIGNAGIDFSTANGLDVSDASGLMYLASPATSSGPQANLYTVNQATGAVTLIGLIGLPGDDILIRGLTVASVPEPSSLALLAIGGLLIGFLRRRK
jgi:hypothetical protein